MQFSFKGATAEQNGQQPCHGLNAAEAGSVGSYQSSGGSPESHSALSPVHSPGTHNGHNGAMNSPIHSAVILRDLTDPDDYRMAFKQESLDPDASY